jgi:DUF1365 family protein
MHSAIYHGWLEHRRFAPRTHSFRYRLFYLYLDLDELDCVFQRRWFWSASSAALARFRRSDHLGDPQIPLDQAVRNLVGKRTGKRPAGPIRLLTHLRYFGHCFNPVSFYYCFDAADTKVEVVVAEVNNTPWGEQHCYVLGAESQAHPNQYLQFRSDKVFHVSPFMPMDLEYRWNLTTPGSRLKVHMALAPARDAPGKLFDATLSLRHAPITGPRLAWMLARFPAVTVQVVVAIHWQALRLWAKRIPIHNHPASAGH